MARRVSERRRAFTLVELLVVIAIIGVLVGLLMPAAFSVYRRVRIAAIKLEVQTIASAIEQYRTKYNDYPPDGSSWEIFEAHIRKTFPQIDQSELDLLNPSMLLTVGGSFHVRNDSEPFPTVQDLRVMEPGEALVFFLGGFSSDARHPFTGEGGPFKWIDPSNHSSGVQVNISRQNAFFDFDQKRLTVRQVSVPGISYPISVSTDEELLQMSVVNPSSPNTLSGIVNDMLPMYIALDTDVPYAFFDSRTYARLKPSGYYFNRMVFFNTQSPPSLNGIPRPYKSDTRYDSPAPSGPTGTAEDHRYRYLNEKTFQLLHPGADGMYGGDPGLGPLPVLFRFPSGKSDVGNIEGYISFKFWDDEVSNDNKASRQADNIANFSAGALGDAAIE